MSLETMNLFGSPQPGTSPPLEPSKHAEDDAYYSQCIAPETETIVQEIYEEAKFECAKYGYDCYRKFAVIYVKTPYDLWCFEARRGKIQLKHNEKELFHCAHKEFHTHFRENITIPELILYIFEHTQAKFTNEFVQFSTKIGRADKN